MQQQPIYSYQANPGTVTMQPGRPRAHMWQWMAQPALAGTGVSYHPPGLDYLAHVDKLFVHQMIEVLEVATGWETKNRYRIFNTAGEQVYYAFEESDCCCRQCCQASRSFIMHIVDQTNQEIIRVKRPFKCCSLGPCCGCCLDFQDEIVVEAPVGCPIGYAVQDCYCMTPSFTICDAARTPVFRVKGPGCIICPRCCCDYDFDIKTIGSGGEIGKITKKWSGFAQEIFTDADNFGVAFPVDLDVRLKATLMGVLFLIDFTLFEDNHS